MISGLGIVGNCSYSALIAGGSVEWLCWPRPDASFVVGPLLDRERGGSFTIEGVGMTLVEQAYVENTNVLRSVFAGETGSFELIDFAPRFIQYDRSFKPTMLVRIVRPLSGDPRVRVACEPVWDYGQAVCGAWRASNHIEFTGTPAPLRLTTNASLTAVEERRPFLLERNHHFVLTWGEPLEAGLEETAERFLERTLDYWRRWVKSMRVPREYQREVIRSALVLKLHEFEDTGALYAATTTSIPEHPGSGRTWDYRYCWLRDAYFTLGALERLGHADEMERFLVFLRNLAEERSGELQPVYTISGGSEAEERELAHLSGFRGDGPVRVGNQAFHHVQNDVYGEMILAVSRLVLDRRFTGARPSETTVGLVKRLLARIEEQLEAPDAGPWELRGTRKLHSFSVLMHWAGAARATEIGAACGASDLQSRAAALRDRAAAILWERCWDAEVGALTQSAGEKHLDASLLLAVQLGFFAGEPERAGRHVDAIRADLSLEGGLIRRYGVEDDFGAPEAAFTACSFWLVEALALLGRRDEAALLFEKLLGLANGLGLYSEDILPATGLQSGNFPQTYTHVGLINAAFRLSRQWD